MIVNEQIKAEKSFQLIRNTFPIGDDFDPSMDHPFDHLHAKLTEIVKHLLDREFNQLLMILYRIDVSEEKVKNILELSPPDSLASDLAQAILDRQRQKVELRMKYST